MQHILEALVSSYDQAKCNRRELLAALGALLATRPGEAVETATVRCRELNHITLRVSNLGRSKQFYSQLLGLPVIKEDKDTCYLGLGRGFLALWQSSDSGVDHWCVGVEPFTRARATTQDRTRDPVRDRLKRDGFSLREDQDDPTIYVRDPDGFVMQLEAAGFKA